MMKLVFHGGKCCGIKTIHGMGSQPFPDKTEGAIEYFEPALTALDKDRRHDKVGAEVSSDLMFYHLSAPKESKVDRLDRYLEYVKKYRPSGVVEIVLAKGLQTWVDQMAWEPELVKRGFKLVNKCLNSNSRNTIYIFHLNVGE